MGAEEEIEKIDQELLVLEAKKAALLVVLGPLRKQWSKLTSSIKQLQDEKKDLNIHLKHPNKKCFLCTFDRVVRQCECGDHSYGPPDKERKFGEWLCRKCSSRHGDCANWGNW